ncbi:MAG: hypothetical protein L0I33_08875 [Acetobacter sp.]|nr:hypothetical protein [Acetobacter sp.]
MKKLLSVSLLAVTGFSLAACMPPPPREQGDFGRGPHGHRDGEYQQRGGYGNSGGGYNQGGYQGGSRGGYGGSGGYGNDRGPGY